MNIKIIYRGQLKEKTGHSSAMIALEGEGTLEDLWQLLRKKYGYAVREMLFDDSGRFRKMMLVILNGTQVALDEPKKIHLREGDEVILMSPIAGG